MNVNHKKNDSVAYESIPFGSLLLKVAESLIGRLNDRHTQSSFLASTALFDGANEWTSNPMENSQEFIDNVTWDMLRKQITSFKGGDLIAIASRPYVDKTNLALRLVFDMPTKQKSSILIFSLEMNALQMTQKLLSLDAGLDTNHWEDQLPQISTENQQLIEWRDSNKYYIIIYPNDNATLDRLWCKIGQLRRCFPQAFHGLKSTINCSDSQRKITEEVQNYAC